MHLRLLRPDGTCDTANAPHLTEQELLHLYRDMVMAQTYNKRIDVLYTLNKIHTHPKAEGWEALHVASTHALAKKDWVAPTVQDTGVNIVRGTPLENHLLILAEREEGNVLQTNMLPFNTGSKHLLHAIGFALTKKNTVIATYVHDTTQADFTEACQAALEQNAPVIFFCTKPLATHIPTTEVESADPIAIYKATTVAADKARKGKGPSCILCYKTADALPQAKKEHFTFQVIT